MSSKLNSEGARIVSYGHACGQLSEYQQSNRSHWIGFTAILAILTVYDIDYDVVFWAVNSLNADLTDQLGASWLEYWDGQSYLPHPTKLATSTE